MRRSALIVLALAVLPCLAAPGFAQVPPQPPAAAPSFHELDGDRDGRVSLAEVMAYATKKSAAVRPFRIQDVDLDGDGMLTQEEFQKAGIKGFESCGTVNARDLNISGDGYVSRQDLDRYFERKHREEFARADANHDASLSPSEFALFRF